MKAVRLTRTNTLNEKVSGDRGAVLILEDDEARHAVEVHHIAEYEPKFDPSHGEAAAIQMAEAQEEVTFAGPDHAAQRLEELKKLVAESDVPPLDPAQGLHGRTWQAESAPAGEDLTGFGEDPAPAAGVKQPWTTAPKSDWIDWAVRGDHGQPRCTPEDAALLTKAQLMSRYGERL